MTPPSHLVALGSCRRICAGIFSQGGWASLRLACKLQPGRICRAPRRWCRKPAATRDAPCCEAAGVAQPGRSCLTLPIRCPRTPLLPPGRSSTCPQTPWEQLSLHSLVLIGYMFSSCALTVDFGLQRKPVARAVLLACALYIPLLTALCFH